MLSRFDFHLELFKRKYVPYFLDQDALKPQLTVFTDPN